MLEVLVVDLVVDGVAVLVDWVVVSVVAPRAVVGFKVEVTAVFCGFVVP